MTRGSVGTCDGYVLNLPVLHEQALAATRRVVVGVSSDQWGQPTPCTEWNAHDVLNHIVSENLWVAPLMSGKTIEEVGDRFDADVLGDDPLRAYDTSAHEAAAAFQAPGAMDALVAVSYGPIPGSVYAGHRLIDVVIHGWDLAKGTGQDASIDPFLLEAVWEIVEPQANQIRQSGMFGAEVTVPEGADLQTRLLALLGRRA